MIIGKPNKTAIEHLTHLIESPLNQILEDTKKCTVDALNMLIIKWSKHVEQLPEKWFDKERFVNIFQTYIQNTKKLESEGVSKHFSRAMKTVHDELGRREEEDVENLKRTATEILEEVKRKIHEASISLEDPTQRCADQDQQNFPEKYMSEIEKSISEEMQRIVNKIKNQVKCEIEKSQKEAMTFLTQKAKILASESYDKSIKIFQLNLIEQFLQYATERLNYVRDKIQKLFEEAQKSNENIIHNVRKQTMRNVLKMVMLVYHEVLRPELNVSPGSGFVPIMEKYNNKMQEVSFCF